MVEREDIIICDGIPKDKYIIAIKKAVIYGILSVPYTIDRMGYGNSIVVDCMVHMFDKLFLNRPERNTDSELW